MTLVRQLMASVENHPVEDIRAMQRASAAQLQRSRNDFLRLTQAHFDATQLRSSLEGIANNGLTNQGTNALMFRELDRLGVEVNGQGLESIDDVDGVYQAGMEGLGHFINRLKDRFTQWRDTSKLKGDMGAGKLIAPYERMTKSLNDVERQLKTFKGSDSAKVKVSTLRAYLSDNGRFPTDPVGWAIRTSTAQAKFRDQCVKNGKALMTAFQSALMSLDLSSENAFRKTWLSKGKTMEALFIKKMPADVEYSPATETYLREQGSAAAWKAYLGGDVESKMALNTWLWAPNVLGSGEARGMSMVSIKVTDALALIDHARKMADKYITTKYISELVKDIDHAQNILLQAYLIEAQEDLRSAKHVNNTGFSFRPGSLQQMAGPMYSYLTDVNAQSQYAVLQLVHLAVQLSRRLVTALKQ